MWTFDVNHVTQNNSYVQLLATQRVFLPCDLPQVFTKRNLKPAVVRVFVVARRCNLPLALQVQNLDWAVRGVTGSCSGCLSVPCNAEKFG